MGAKASSQIIERFATLPFVIPELLMKSIGFGVMIAPTIGGLLTASQDFSAIFVVGGVTVVLSLLAGLLALRKGLPD